MSSKGSGGDKVKEFTFPDALKTQIDNVIKTTEILLKHLKALKLSPTEQLITLVRCDRCPLSTKQTVRSAFVNAIQLLPKENGTALCENGLVPELFHLIEDPPSPAHAQATIQALNLVLQHCDEALLGEDDATGVVSLCISYARDKSATYKLRVGALRFLTDIVTRKKEAGARLLEKKNGLTVFPEVVEQWAPMPAHYQDGVFSAGLRQCFAALNALQPVASDAVVSAPGVISGVLSVIEAHSPVAPEAVAFLLTISTTPAGRKAIMSAEKPAYKVLAKWLPLYEEDEVRCNMVRVLTNLCVDDENVQIIGKHSGMLECLHDILDNAEVDSTLWECATRCLNNMLSPGIFDEKWIEIGGLTTLVKQLRKSKKAALVEPLFIVLGNMLLSSENARHVIVAEHGIKMLIGLLENDNVNVVEQAARSLCNLCSCSREARRPVFHHDGLPALLNVAGKYAELPKASAYAMEAIISLSDCATGIRTMISNPKKGAEIMRTLVDRASDNKAPAELRAFALDSLANISRSNDLRILFIQTTTPDPILDIICEAAKSTDKDSIRLTQSACAALTNFAADGRTRLWFKKLDASKKAALEAVEKDAPEGSAVKASAKKVLDTLGFQCEDSYPEVNFDDLEEKKKERRAKKREREEVGLDQMDLDSLQMHLEEQQKVANNAQIAYDFAKQETASSKKKCQHEKKKLKSTQDDHAKRLKEQQAENEKVDKEHESVTVPAEKQSIQQSLMGEFEKSWPTVMKDLKKNKKMKADAIAAEEARMKKDVMKKIEIEQEKCILKNEVRKEKAATDLHVRKMKFLLEERALAHAYHCSKFIYSKAQEDEKEALEVLERENAKVSEIESLIERVVSAQKAEEERAKKQKELEAEQLKQAGADEAAVAAKIAKEQEEAKKKQQQQRRTFIVNEICDTEENYVNGLSHALTVYRAPLLEAARHGKKGAILTNDQINSIFSNMETIRDYNAVFLDLLKSRINKWDEKTLIGDTFVVISKLLLSYTDYVNNYSRAIDVLGKLRAEIPAFSAFMDEADREDVNLKLVSILIFPIQRVPRYILLLQDLLKHTSSDHPDYRNLEQALDAMNKTGNYINESKREAENVSKLAEINQSLKGKHPAFQKSGRYFLFETAVTLTPDGEKNQQHGMLYIATDMLLITHAVGRGLSQFDAAIDLSQTKTTKSQPVQTALDVVGPTAAFADEKDQKRYSKVDKKTGKPELLHYVFLMKSLPEVNRWFSKIENTRFALSRPADAKK